MAKFIVKDSLGKMQDRSYFTEYHAEQMARALNLNDATFFTMYRGGNRFTVVAA